MILRGVAEINGEKLYWERDNGICIISDLLQSHMGIEITTNCELYTLQDSIYLFLKEWPWADRVVQYIKLIEKALERQWFEIANNYEKILNENYNVYTFSRESI